MKYAYKRILSAVMVFILVFSSLASSAYAAGGGKAEEYSFLPEEPGVQLVEGSRLPELEGTEAVYFGVASADIREGDRYYSIPVYREGDLETEASVSLLSLDVSALYGADYEFCAESVYSTGQEYTLLEKQNGRGVLMSEEEVAEQAELLAQLYEEKTGTEEEAAESMLTSAEESDADALSEADTESGTEDSAGTGEYGSIKDIVMEELSINNGDELTDEQISEFLKSDELDYSAGYVLHFAKGEAEKQVVFHIMEDELEEGEEMFQFILADAENTVIRSQYVFGAVITDNEELHDSQISFEQESVTEEMGIAKVTVVRTGSEYSMIEFQLHSVGDTATAGENYTEFNETMVMQPYQEKTSFEFEVRGQGRMEVFLTAETACEVVGTDTCEVLIDVQETEEELEQFRASKNLVDELNASSGSTEEPKWETVIEQQDDLTETNHFDITIGKAKYRVQYTGSGPDVQKGVIEDEKGEPVGDYYFTSNKYFNYFYHGASPNLKYSANEYVTAENLGESHAKLHWHCHTVSSTGGSSISSKFKIPTTWYRYWLPDWQGLSWINYYQCYWVESYLGSDKLSRRFNAGAVSKSGMFDRMLDQRVQINFPYRWENRMVTLAGHGGDEKGAPYTKLWIYGFALMYKAYDVKVMPTPKQKFRTAGGSKLETVPFNLKIRSGGQYVEVYNNAVSFRPASDESTVIQFGVSQVYLNGHTGAFGHVKYWTIEVDPTGQNPKTVTYPSDGNPKKEDGSYDPLDFEGYLLMKNEEYKKSGIPENSYIDYSDDTAIRERVTDAGNSIMSVHMDRYMTDWLAYVYSLTVQPSKRAEWTWGSEPINLSFTPEVGFNEVQVYVLSNKNGSFADSALDPTGAAEKPHIFHTGDTLNLSVKANTGYQVIGYEYSTDNIKFTTVEENNALFLEQGVSRIWVRPVVTNQHNKIEIQYIGDAAEHLMVRDLIDEEELEDTDWAEKNILLINGDKIDAYQKGKPAVGTAYCLDLIVTDPGKDGWIYRPYVEYQESSGKAAERLYGCSYPIIAGANPADNIVRVGAEYVREDSLKTYTVKGLVAMAPLSVKRVTGEKPKNTPVGDFNVSTADRQGKVKSSTENEEEEVAYRIVTKTDLNGCFELKGITGKSGDIISVLATNSINTGYIQRVQLGDAETVSIPEVTVDYPYNAPEVTSVMYLYSNPLYNRDADLTSNVIQIKDCNLDLLITVNEKNRKAKDVKVSLVNTVKKDGKEEYNVKEYTAVRETQSGGRENGSNSDLWRVTISGMNKNVFSGDRMFISIVDDEKLPVTTASGVQGAEIVYPVMDTGLSFALQYQPKKPQFLKNTMLDTEKIELPLLGKGGGNMGASSGLINWKVSEIDGNSYYMNINIGISLNSLSKGKAQKRAKQYSTQVASVLNEYRDEKKKISDEIQHRASLGVAEDDPEMQKYKKQLQALDNKIYTVADVKERTRLADKILGREDAQPKQSTTEYYWNFDTSASINLYWIRGTDNKFHYKLGDVVFSGTFFWERTKFTMLFLKIPGYVNVGFNVQIGYTGKFTPDKTTDLTDATFLDASGNIRDMLMKQNKSLQGTFMPGFFGFLGVGVGMKKVLSARGVVSVKVQAGIPTPKLREPEEPKNPTPEEKRKYEEELKKVKAANQNGVLVKFQGGIEIDLLVTKFSLTLLGGTVGSGSWKNKTSFEFLGISAAGESGSGMNTAEAADAQREVTILSVDEENQEVYALKEKLPGTSVMDGFGSGVREGAMTEDGSYAIPQILLENAADNPDVQMVQTDDKGSLFMVFAGSRGEGNGSVENGNAEAIYYTVYTTDGTQGSWSRPVLLDKDGTYDAKPTLTVSENREDDREGKIVTVTWSSSEEEFEKKHSLLDKVSMLRIKAASFLVDGADVQVLCAPTYVSGKKASDSIRQKEEKGENKASGYMDVAGQSWYSGGKLYSSFTRFDLKNAESIEDLMDINEIDPKVYMAETDFNAEVPVLNSLYDISLTNEDTMLYNSTARLVEISGAASNEDKKLVVFSYTQDSDGNENTEEDLNLKLCLVELYDDGKEPLVYPSMDISWELGHSEDSPGLVKTDMGAWVDQSRDPDGDGIEGMALTNAEITQAGEEYYLTYVKNGCLFETINIGKSLQAMFEEDYIADLYRAKAKSVYGGKAATKAGKSTSEDPWYKVTVSELNQAWSEVSEGEGPKWYSIEETVTEEQNEDLLIFEGSELDSVGSGSFFTLESTLGSSGQAPGINNYQVVSDGDALFVIFAKLPDDTLDPAEELFCVRLNLGGDGISAKNPDQTLAYSDPVQLTDAGHVITNFKAAMSGGKITVVSDYYDQYIPEEGGIRFGANNIAVLQYVPKSNLKVDPYEAGFTIACDADEEGSDYVRVYYDIKNFGLVPGENYRTWAVHDGKVVFEKEVESTQDGEARFLREGESDEYSFWYKTDDVTKEDTVTVWLQVGDKEPESFDIGIFPTESLEITMAKAENGENGCVAYITVSNNGTVGTEATTLALKYADVYEDNELVKAGEFLTKGVPVSALAAGEETVISIPFRPKKEDYSYLGAVDFEAVLGEDEEQSTFEFTYAAGGPDSILIEDGKESISLTRGSSRQLKTELVPAPEAAPKMYYCSSDPEVVTIDENGKMICLKNGAATVYAYATGYSFSGSITVYVTAQGDDDEPVSVKLPSYVEQDGSWKQDENGNWTYTTKAGVKAADRWMAIARSTFGGGDGFEWYRFDKNGLMVTGWFRDSDDRMYYLQTVSDGNKGRMLTGWQQIGKKWYYFNTVSDGYKGAMHVNTATPDGYTVGKDGAWDGKPKK